MFCGLLKFTRMNYLTTKNRNLDSINELDLPENIKIIPPSEKINPYYFHRLIDGGVTCFGTSGLEIALAGKPVILVGKLITQIKDLL